MIGYPASYAHGSYAFNSQVNSAGAEVTASVHATTTIDEVEINTGFRDIRDPYHLAQGGGLGRDHKGFTSIRIAGRLQGRDASQRADLSDRERALLAAFDPSLCVRDSPSTDGAYAFDFSDKTIDTATYPSGLIPLRYYARPDGKPRTRATLGEGGSRQYALALIAPDPRAYEQTEQSLSLTSGAPSGAVLNRGTAPAPLKATITTSGNGSPTFTITRSGVSFILNLSAVGVATVVVVFETCGPYGRGRYITKGGIEAFSLKASSPSTWLDVRVGSTTFTMSNTTNVTSCVLNWFSARA